MAETKPLTPADPCPNCGGEFALDLGQHPDAVIERHGRNAASPNAHALFADQTRAKAAEHGLIHACRSCRYRARMKPAGEPARGRGRGRQQTEAEATA